MWAPLRTYDAFGDLGSILREREWKTPIFSGRVAPRTPDASHLQLGDRALLADEGPELRAEDVCTPAALDAARRPARALRLLGLRPVVGRGHASLFTDLDAYHAAPLRSYGHWKPGGSVCIDILLSG